MIILIPTCLKYSDIVPIFVDYFNRFWPDCPYEKILINSDVAQPGFQNWNVEDRGWTANLLAFLATTKTQENIVLLLDDYILTTPIQTRDIRFLDQQRTNEIAYVRLIPYSDNSYGEGYGWRHPGKEHYNELLNYADISEWKRLPVSLQPAIWSPDFIKSYFRPDWSPWQMEVLGSKEYCKYGTINGKSCNWTFLCVKKEIYSYCNAVRDGKYSEQFVDLLEKDGVPFCFTRRPISPPCSKLTSKEVKELKQRQVNGTYPKSPMVMMI